MPSAGTADVTGFSPFPNEGIITGMGAAKKINAQKLKKAPAACPPLVVAHDLISSHETVVLKTKPFSTLGTMDGHYPVSDTGKEINAYGDDSDNYDNTHEPTFLIPGSCYVPLKQTSSSGCQDREERHCQVYANFPPLS
jgi:hypothetical protein